MNIAFFSDSFWPTINGVVTYVTETALQLKKMGHHLLLVVPYSNKLVIPHGFDKDDLFLAKSLPVDRLYPGWRVALFYSSGLDRALTRFHPDVVHIHTIFTVGLGGVIAARRFGKPLVSTYHTYIASEEVFKVFGVTKGRGTRVIKKMMWEYTKSFHNRSDLVLAPTKEISMILKRNGISAPVEVLAEGIDLSHFNVPGAKEREKLRRDYSLSGRKVIVYVGRLSAEKNLILTLQVVKDVAAAVPSVLLLLIGDGPQKEELLRTARKLGIEDHVRFLGMIEREKLFASGLLSACDLFLTTSKFETFGLTTLEAIASGLPVVAVESQGACELIEGNGLVSSEDRADLTANVIKVLTHPGMAERFRNQSLILAERYSVVHTTARLTKIYEKIIAEGEPKTPFRHPTLADLSRLLGL